MTHTHEFYARSERIEQLAAKLEQAADPELHATAMELLQCVMDLHGAGLDRVMQLISKTEDADPLIRKLLDDNLVSGLLLLHNLHPEDLETRVLSALEKVRPQLESHSCQAELLAIHDGVVSLRLIHSGGGCKSTPATMAALLEDTLAEAAPDATRISVETVEPAAASQLITIAQIAPKGDDQHATSANHAY